MLNQGSWLFLFALLSFKCLLTKEYQHETGKRTMDFKTRLHPCSSRLSNWPWRHLEISLHHRYIWRRSIFLYLYYFYDSYWITYITCGIPNWTRFGEGCYFGLFIFLPA